MRINNLWLALICLVSCSDSQADVSRTSSLRFRHIPRRQPISHGRVLHTNLRVRIQIKYIAGFCFHNNSPK